MPSQFELNGEILNIGEDVVIKVGNENLQCEVSGIIGISTTQEFIIQDCATGLIRLTSQLSVII